MKVIAINGSPHADGNTSRALQAVGAKLAENSVDFEIIQVGNKNIRGCLACGKCAQTRDEKCSQTDDLVNDTIQKMKNADGIIIASPVYYSGVAGTMKCFLDRAFYVAGCNGGLFRHKVGAALTAVRRTGGSSALDCLNHYLTYSEMIIAASNYWNVIHGRLPGEAVQDAEGIQIMEVLGSNIAWLLAIRNEAEGKITRPERVKKIATNFIR